MIRALLLRRTSSWGSGGSDPKEGLNECALGKERGGETVVGSDSVSVERINDVLDPVERSLERGMDFNDRESEELIFVGFRVSLIFKKQKINKKNK